MKDMFGADHLTLDGRGGWFLVMSYSIICFIFLLGRSINYKTYQSRCVLSHQCLLLFVFEFPWFHVQVSQKLFLSQQESCCCIKLSNAQNVLVEKTLSTVFSTCFTDWNQLPKICQRGWKERFEITNTAVFQSGLFLLETNGDIAPQTGGIFTDVGAHTNRDFV